MEDRQIVALYWQRDERAIGETEAKYGAFCRALAQNLLKIREDAEECVNDTWHAAWRAMPTARPERLGPWLGRVVRNLAIDRWRRDHRQKRYDGMEALLSELEDCVPAPADVEREIEARELGRSIDRWLGTLTEADRALFVRRYWSGERLAALAAEEDIPAGRLAGRLARLRQRLKTELEKEGISL